MNQFFDQMVRDGSLVRFGPDEYMPISGALPGAPDSTDEPMAEINMPNRLLYLVSRRPDIEAWVVTGLPGGVIDTLEVTASRLFPEDDPWRKPINDYLACRCFRKSGESRGVADSDWIFGRYDRTWFEIFDVCPGAEVKHNCWRERTES